MNMVWEMYMQPECQLSLNCMAQQESKTWDNTAEDTHYGLLG